jgi:hypothetical protein
MEKTPHQIAEERIGIAEEYSRYSGLYADLIKKRAEHYKVERNAYKSDTATERAWERTDEGTQMTIIKLKLKTIEKKMSASNTMLRLLENESKNLY